MINDRPTKLIVNLDAVLNNYKKFVELAGDKKVIAVVKANSYSLGADKILELLYDNGARYFAVATLEEAIELRKKIKDGLILVLGVTNPLNVNYAIENNVSLCCPSEDWLTQAISAVKNNSKLKVHVKLETGMNRIGIFDKEELRHVDNLLKSEKIIFEGVFSHFAQADGENNIYDNQQIDKFNDLLSTFTKKPTYIHLDNSAGTIKYHNCHADYQLVRVGISLYGEYPSSNIEKLYVIKLETVASLVSKVTHVKKIKKGSKVGYGSTYEAKEDEYIATIPIGYADGLLRRAQGYKIIVGDELCEIVGRVCMDQLMVRCSENIKVGDDVIFFGECNNKKLSIDDFADYQNTISYEILCAIHTRVPRVYLSNGKEI